MYKTSVWKHLGKRSVKYLGDDDRTVLKGIFSKCGTIGKYKNYPCTDLNKPLRLQ